MTTNGRRSLILCTSAIVYVCLYIGYRTTHTEVWQRDGRPYVIFGSRVAYYAFRPISYVDGAATGIGFHIGPHE
jgi:hypothetical protein